MLCFNQPPSSEVRQAREFYLQQTVGPTAEHRRVEDLRLRGAHVLVKLVGIETRTDAEGVIGMVMSLPEDVLPAPAPGEFYYYEVVGFRVRTTGGTDIGTIRETFFTGSNDVWVIADGEREHLVPVIADVVHTIDRDTRTVTIEPMEGMLDL